jgi:hypothetical protein
LVVSVFVLGAAEHFLNPFLHSIDDGCGCPSRPSSLSCISYRFGDAPIGLHRMIPGLLQTLLVAEPSPGVLPGSDPDLLIKWFIGVVVMGLGVNLLTGLVATQKWAWLPPAVFVAALLVVMSSTGLLRAERYRTTQAHRMALLALTGYLVIIVWGSVTDGPSS